MTPEQWRQIEELYHTAQKCRPNERAVLLECTDPEVRLRVERMLEVHSGSQILSAVVDGSFAEPTETVVIPGAQLGPYTIEAEVGAGGMGTVYRALDTRLGRTVAIKVAAERYSERFQREARTISTLNHPNICTLYDVGPNYLVMEFIEGRTLAAEIKDRPLALEAVARYGGQIANALAEAHALGIIHRDLKPSNIMVTRHGIKVLDFGLAKILPSTAARPETGLTETGGVMGTPAYMSPEQILGEKADARSDVFALGIILYQMTSGRHPWPQSTIDTMHAILHDDPPPIDDRTPGVRLPAGALERVVRRCLAKAPDRRYQSMAELAAALQQVLKDPDPAFTEKRTSIAVLPFENMSGDKENEYFGDGLAEEVINMLAQITGIKVAGRTSSFFFRGKDIEFGEIAKRLNVEHVLEGSVRKAGNRVRITAQLIKASDGFHIWSERYDREMTDIFVIQDEITRSIATALRVKLAPESVALRRPTSNLRAYEAYLKAREQWFGKTPASLGQIKASLEQAIALDPTFALAHSLLGVYYTAQLRERPACELIPLARAAQEEALRVDPSLPEAQALLGCCAGMDYEWGEAERRWRLATAHEPVPRDVLFWYANHYLLPIGRPLEAAQLEAIVLEEDPLNLLYRHHYAVALHQAGRIMDAQAELRRVLDVNENFVLALGTLGALCAQQGQFEEALNLTERAEALMPESNPLIGQLAAILVRSRASARANTLLDRLNSSHAYGAPTGLATFYALCGDSDQAAHWAEKAIEERHPNVITILTPLLKPGPHWPSLARLMNLPG